MWQTGPHVIVSMYLPVQNAKGELLGLMKGPFPEAVLRSGFVQFVIQDPVDVDLAIDRYDPSAQTYRVTTLHTRPQVDRTYTTTGWRLETSLALDALRRISAFR